MRRGSLLAEPAAEPATRAGDSERGPSPSR